MAASRDLHRVPIGHVDVRPPESANLLTVRLQQGDQLRAEHPGRSDHQPTHVDSSLSGPDVPVRQGICRALPRADGVAAYIESLRP